MRVIPWIPEATSVGASRYRSSSGRKNAMVVPAQAIICAREDDVGHPPPDGGEGELELAVGAFAFGRIFGELRQASEQLLDGTHQHANQELLNAWA